MDRPRLVRGLRIAVSAVCGLLCILLIGLWVRSYRWHDYLSVQIASKQFIDTMSENGKLVASNGHAVSGMIKLWIYDNHKIGDVQIERGEVDQDGTRLYPGIGFKRIRWANGSGIVVPHWFLVLLSFTFAAAPWIRWSFSVRTLLIATTLIAVALGLLVWSLR